MKKVTIILQYSAQLGSNGSVFDTTVKSIIKQNYSNWELIIVDDKGKGIPKPGIVDDSRIKYLSDNFKNRAVALNTAVNQASGEYIVLVNNISATVKFKVSALELLMMIAERTDNCGFIYSDYQLIDAEGNAKDIHLVEYHQGKVRDNMDYGALLFFPKSVFSSVNGFNEDYKFAEIYDYRLKISSQFKIVHVNAAKNGHLYSIKSAAISHNVFDYLMAGKEVQLEMEHALTRHLNRIGAYLEPGKYDGEVNYSDEEERKFTECIASIVIPVFDRKEFIGTAIESVQAQTVQNVEVIVVTNGGKDDPTIEGVKPYLAGGAKYDPHKPNVRLFVEDINNIGFCLNKGIREARGKYYIQLDSDDRLKPDAIEKIVKVFDSDKRIGMVIGSYEVWKKDDETKNITRMEEIPVVTHDEWTEENGRNNLLRINGAGAPRAAHIKVIQQLGGFGMNDSDYCRNYGEDYDLVLRISEQYRIGRVWEPIYEVIRHSGGTDHSIDQITIDRNDNAKDLMRKKAIERRIKMNES